LVGAQKNSASFSAVETKNNKTLLTHSYQYFLVPIGLVFEQDRSIFSHINGKLRDLLNYMAGHGLPWEVIKTQTTPVSISHQTQVRTP